jgi:hypothetical protein
MGPAVHRPGAYKQIKNKKTHKKQKIQKLKQHTTKQNNPSKEATKIKHTNRILEPSQKQANGKLKAS